MRRRTGWLLAGAVVLAVTATAAALTTPWRGEEPPDVVAAAWMPLWDRRSTDSLERALEDGGVTEVSPTWATVRADGGLNPTPPSSRVRRALADAGVRVVPVVQNFSEGAWQGQRTAELLADPETAARHRAELVRLAVEEGWDGVDIDYETLPSTSGPAFVRFLEALREDLHGHGIELSVAVPARTADDEPGTLAYSYQMIGRVADQVRVMAYDDSWAGSAAGPVAPLAWVRAVAAYAADRVPHEKLMLGVATYGYDWIGSTGAYLGAAEAFALAERVGAAPRWDDATGSMTFDYTDEQGQRHTVWFEDARSLGVKQDVAVAAGFRGVALWALGTEDPAVWTVLAERSLP